MPKTSQMSKVVAWGQYVHWAHLQFERFAALQEGDSDSHRIGVAAHWLAAEYVVLEGWQELAFSDERLSKLIQLYPENSLALRRCRNAVYHFQTKVLDERIVRCLVDENEALQWSVALHGEFQRFLVRYPYTHPGTIKERAELAEEMALCIGWMPHRNPSAAILRVVRQCLELEGILAARNSSDQAEGHKLIASTLRELASIDKATAPSNLSRWLLTPAP